MEPNNTTSSKIEDLSIIIIKNNISKLQELLNQTTFSINTNDGSKLSNISNELNKHSLSKTSKEFELLSYLESTEQNSERKTKGNNNEDRYSDIVPFKYSNVILRNSNYINASWIHLPYNNSFIGTQGPKSNTQEDFWNMVIENKINKIVMVCNLEENGRSKCYKYWPNLNTQLKFNNFNVSLEEETYPLKEKDLLERKLIIELKNKCNKKLEIKQLQYLGWPDHGVPSVDLAYPIFNYMYEAINSDVSDNTPVLVHCSAGIGRTGTFISSYNIWRSIQLGLKSINNNKTNVFNISIFDVVRLVKECRCFSVENINQYNFIYNIIAKHISKIAK